MASKPYLLICAISIYIVATAAREKHNTDITVHETPAAEESLSNKVTVKGEASENLGKRCFVPTAEGRRVQISIRLSRIEENQKQQNLELALATTKLTELEKIGTAENINDLTPSNKLTRWQRNLLNEIARTKARKEDLTVDTAVTKTMVEQLKIILVANGGSANTNSASSSNENRLNNQIKLAQERKQKISADIARVTAELEQLQNPKNTQNSANNVTPTTTVSQSVLTQIERTKEKKYDLTLQLALTNTLIEQLQLQLNGTNSSDANSANKDTTKNGSTNSSDANSTDTTANGSTNSSGANASDKNPTANTL